MKKYSRRAFCFPVLCFLLAALYGCAPRECESCLRILFVGNSYTSTNNLPGAFANLADSGGHQVEVGMFGNGGWSLSEHAQAPKLSNTLQSSRWNYVIVQEQSEIPAVEQSRIMLMHPAARAVIGKIRGVGAQPIFFQTWAHRAGMPANGMDNFESMQYEIDMGYLGIAQELDVPIAPVGDAWFNAVTQYPQLQLWQEDGSHPTAQGTYLAACVFYAVIFNESPQGLSYVGNIPAETAHQLQEIAARTAVP